MVLAALFDELCSGVTGFASPDIQRTFQVTYGQATGWLLAAFMVTSVVLEPPLLLLADRWPRRPMMVVGVLGMAGCCVAAGFAPSYAWLVASLVLLGPSIGLATGVAQASLMDAHADNRSRMMTRWTLAAGVGDLMTPALFVGLVKLGFGWRETFLTCGGLLLVYAIFVAASAMPAPPGDSADEDEEPGLLEALTTALQNRALLRWTAACVVCLLLDETLIAFGALHLRDHLGADEALRSVILSTFLVGGILGLLVADALLARVDAMRVLLGESVVCCVAYAGWLHADTALLSSVTMFFAGFSAAALYPIAKAQAYMALPGKSGAVAAVASLFTVVEIVLPLGLAWVADTLGLLTALTMLGFQPAFFLVVAVVLVVRRSAVVPRKAG